ncbi:MAG: hypothetical protein IPG07_15615 [Crocinitomicaceae bacterium]|nr:hypothetical protein [Crocinitomicaceae bacterium]
METEIFASFINCVEISSIKLAPQTVRIALVDMMQKTPIAGAKIIIVEQIHCKVQLPMQTEILRVKS